LEVTRQGDESKARFLERILNHGSQEAKILKVCDRISNLTDLNSDSTSPEKIASYLDDTEKYIIPMAACVNQHDMQIELKDLVAKRRSILQDRFFSK
jgi:(p)ppGpp synthase/HD superfamily hydrolase